MNNFILFIVTLFCWSPTWYVIKFQLGYVDPLVSVFYRFLIAGIVIFVYLIYKKKNLKFSLNQHLWFLLFGVCLYSLNYVFFYLSNTYLISAFPAVVFSTVVIMNILGERFYFKKNTFFKNFNWCNYWNDWNYNYLSMMKFSISALLMERMLDYF